MYIYIYWKTRKNKDQTLSIGDAIGIVVTREEEEAIIVFVRVENNDDYLSRNLSALVWRKIRWQVVADVTLINYLYNNIQSILCTTSQA